MLQFFWVFFLLGDSSGGGAPTPMSDIYNSPRWVVHNNGSLLIAQVQESDAGTYACQVDNGIAPALSKNIALKVNGG